MGNVDVIIVNWNGRHLLGSCLDSLLANRCRRDREITVYDNGSVDGSVAFLETSYPDVRVLRGRRNLGFAPAVNRSIRATSGEFVALLNNDAAADPGWIEALVQVAESDGTIGMVASQMVFWDDASTINSAGIEIDRCGIAWDRLGGRSVAEAREPAEIFGPCGGAALYRRALFDQVGLFDDDYFAYLEDVDLAWRARLAGWRCVYTPLARVRHRHSATGVEGSPLKNFLLGRNKIWTIFKNYPTPELFRYLPAILGYDGLTVPYRLLLKSDASSLRGRLAGFAALPAILRKRRRIQRLATPAGRAQTWQLMRPIETPLAVQARYRHLERRLVPESATEAG